MMDRTFENTKQTISTTQSRLSVESCGYKTPRVFRRARTHARMQRFNADMSIKLIITTSSKETVYV